MNLQASCQQVIEVIGFGQPTASAQEGESRILKIRLEPDAVDTDISGYVVPLSVPQYRDYTFATYPQRSVLQEVQDDIDMIVDEAECE